MVAGGADSTALAASVSPGISPPATVAAIPPAALGVYARAATACPGLSWTILAAVGTVESANGTADLPGVTSGHNLREPKVRCSFSPLRSTSSTGRFHPEVSNHRAPMTSSGTEAYTAAPRMLLFAMVPVATATLGQALFDYNHSGSYVAKVLSVALSYGFDAGSVRAGGIGARVGGPYLHVGCRSARRIGGEVRRPAWDSTARAWFRPPGGSPGSAFRALFAAAQMAAGPAVASGEPLAPGDLVFFGPGVGDVTHVGMVVDPAGVMVDAPHTGASVRVEPFPTAVGASWGSDLFLGATRPW